MPGLEGTTLGRYYLLRRLGHGGMSEVYLARDKRLDNEVAVKVVSGSHSDYLERFRRETEAVSRLKHAHILPALDYGDKGFWHYLVMPYIAQGTLLELLTKEPLTVEHVGELLAQIASALQFAHDNGIIHRDIKPSNILLQDDHYAFLADFGLAKELEGTDALTQSGLLLGTPEYMAPDLSEGPATTSCDLYALGILLYQMVAGRVPFSAETPIALYWKQIREQPLPPSHFNPALPPSIDSVVLCALEKKPHHRFASVQALSDAYQQALQDPDYEPAEVLSRSERISDAYAQQSLLDTASIALPPLPVKRSRRQSGQVSPATPPGKLILPGNPLLPPSALTAEDTGLQAQAVVMPPLPMRSTRVAPDTPATPAQLESPRQRKPYSQRRKVMTNVIGIGILLFVALPMTLIYYAYSTDHARAIAMATATTSTQRTLATQQAQADQQAHSTATAIVALTVTSSTPLITDNLISNINGRWLDNQATCTFLSKAYHAYVTGNNARQACPLLKPPAPLDNATFQVDVTLLSGDSAGMLLRVNGQQYYDFEINNQGQFFFQRHDADGTSNNLIKNTANSVILPGSLKNTLLAIANGDTFKLYVNSVFVGETQDDRYTGGQFALVAGTSTTSSSGEASFNNFEVFQNIQ